MKTDPGHDETDYRHRARVNVVAGLAIAVLVLISLVTVKIFYDHEKLQNCIDSGRRNCIDLNVAPRSGVVVLPAR